MTSLLPASDTEVSSNGNIREVVKACDCSEAEAQRLLKQCGNSVDEAKLRYDIEKLYGLPTAPPDPHELLLPGKYDFDLLSYDSSDEEQQIVTPTTDEARPNRARPAAQRPPPPKKPLSLRASKLLDDHTDAVEPVDTNLSPHKDDLPRDGRSDVSDTSIATIETGVLKGLDSTNQASNLALSPVTLVRDSVDPGVLVRQTSSPHQTSVDGPLFKFERVTETASITSGPDGHDGDEHRESSTGATVEGNAKVAEWNFVLPDIPEPLTLIAEVGEGNNSFNLLDLVGAMQHGIEVRFVADYLAYYDPQVVRSHLCDTLEGFPSIFYAVATNNEALIRMWIAFGADVAAVHDASGVPLLAFAIMNSEQLDTDSTLTVSTLLSLGAVPEVIPSAFYTPFIDDLPDDGPSDESLKLDLEDQKNVWCTPAARSKLARTANITQRYYLERASKMKKPSSRQKQVAKLRNAKGILGVPYFLIGQTMATNRLLQKLLNYLMVPTKRPLVMVFAGPSGHGKTELAKQLGHLMSLDLEIVDCTIYSREIELFGPRNPYVGAEHGSPLNNFLARNSGRRCIVFLDEFEKTTAEIHKTLLIPFDEGRYQDRRDLKSIDCSKTVWILATNAMDTTIQSFCKLNHKPIFEDDDDSEKLQLMKTLSKAIKEDFLNRFGSPITGRISDFLPFLPFSLGEQAVIVHKFLLELGQRVRGPVSLVPGFKEQLLGNVRLRIRRDASVCRRLAQEEYHIDLGARSLIMGSRKLEDILVDAYLQVDKEIHESEIVVDFMVDINGSEVTGKIVKQAELH